MMLFNMIFSGQLHLFLQISFERLVGSWFGLILLAMQVINLIIPFLAARRLWRMIKLRETVPASFRGFTQYLTYFSIISIVFPVIALIPVVMAGTGSGVPAGMLLLMPKVLLPVAFLLTELMSLRKPAVMSESNSPGAAQEGRQ